MHNILQYQFINDLKALSCVDRIMLYGSRARGDGAARTDLDLAIDCPRAETKDWLKIMDIIDKADTLLKIDCVRFDELSDSNKLKANIIKEAEILFERR